MMIFQYALLLGLALQPIPYPVEDSGKVVRLFDDRKVPIFIYGSLLNPESASRTISNSERAKPALIFGALKTFDRDMPEAPYPKKRRNDTAMLNLYLTGRFYDFTNGALIYVDERELEALLKREKGYDLFPVLIYPYNVQGYAFVARQREFLSRKINPVPKYYELSKRGAARYGDVFLRIWIATTVLADHRTPLADWEKEPTLNMGN